MNVALEEWPKLNSGSNLEGGDKKWAPEWSGTREMSWVAALGKAFSFLGIEEKAVNRLGCPVWVEAGQLY